MFLHRIFFPAECLLEPDSGEGNKYTKRYYFDAKKNRCKKFNYAGEGGNENNFKKKNECSNFCKVIPSLSLDPFAKV